MDITYLYRRIQHDFANQLQLLDAYKQLGMNDKVNMQIDSMLIQVRQEQQFFRLNLPHLLQTFINFKINDRLFEWSFDIDVQTSAIDLFDQQITQDFLNTVASFSKEVIDKCIIKIGIYELDKAIEMKLTLIQSESISNMNQTMSDDMLNELTICHQYQKEVF